MGSITARELPAEALLNKYREQGAYTDCYATEMALPISHADFVEAFYTTPLFKLERLILALLLGRPASDAQARELAKGRLDRFAAWTVEGRAENQLLLCDFQSRTRSWLMVEAAADGRSTRLFFGSAVVPKLDRRSGERRMGAAFVALLGFHKLYSRLLLRAAVARLG
ncbi:hypothetical protein J7U46_10815 [Pelomonas sp. V22]|uniref:hypothetical protein n=1 Tax=Pelomonas sp. V22 TaxID=2822139 RepID=UPI0024A96575|nr:hypothetical protein [Pelomonas sp. V22]MDI4633539.1 hypothetical protein [Pelomonas sp. V22]